MALVEAARSYSSRMRDTSPTLHFSAVVASLLAFSWLGGMLSGFFLLYLLLLVLLMLPGLHKKGLLQKHCASLTLKLGEIIKGKKFE